MIPMLILFNANSNSLHLHLKVMKFIIFLFASIGCHLGWLYYQPSAPFVVQFNQAQPAKRIAVNIIKSQPVKPQIKQDTQPAVAAKQTSIPSTVFHSDVKRVAEQSALKQPKVTKIAASNTIKPKKSAKTKTAPPNKSQPITEVVKQQLLASEAQPESTAPVIADQHSLKNQVIDIKTLPIFKAPRPALNYPLKAKRRGYQGVAILQIELAEDGTISQLTLVQSSGFTELDKAAINNVSQWQFHPVMRDNRSIKARFSVPIEFSLRS